LTQTFFIPTLFPCSQTADHTFGKVTCGGHFTGNVLHALRRRLEIVIGQNYFRIAGNSGLTRQQLPARLLGWAVNPVKARGERDQSYGVVVFSRVQREAVVKTLRFEFVEEARECSCTLRKP
jgi:hypothetical protein